MDPRFTHLALAALLATPLTAQVENLGTIEFPNSGSAEAQDAFLRGALLLHSFEYDDAAEAFQEAQAIDPDFALAYWGEAMTKSHPVWHEDEPEEARAILARYAPTPDERQAKAETERERGLLRCVDVLFGEGERVDRNLAYAQAIGALHARFPDDLEIASFHALAVLGTASKGRDFRIYMRAAGIAEVVYRANPEHPGALHYLIHCYDDPIHAALGLRQAETYAKVAPAASHALHMPSHVFVALGMWSESAASNVDSAAAADARRARKGLALEERAFHALWWLAYSYLQEGRLADARLLLEQMVADHAASGSTRTGFHLARMRGEYLVHTGAWTDAVADLRIEMKAGEDPFWLNAAAADLFIVGLTALERGDLETAAAQAALIHERREARTEEKSGEKLNLGDIACCLPNFDASGYDITPGERNALVFEQNLSGLVALRRGDTERALELFADACANVDAVPFDYGPPDLIKPAHELFGEVLLELGRPAEAAAEFERTLQRAPRRRLSLLGLARAAGAAGDQARARAAWLELADVLAPADDDVPELAELREFLQ